jgi:5-methylcytosine-specific restriction endonuclease McrA
MAKKRSLKSKKIIFDKYGGRCAYCGIKLDFDHFSFDHINPKFKGYPDQELCRMNIVRGENCIDNYNPCCKSCNSSKSTFTLEKWRSEIDKKFGRLMKYEPSFNLLVRLNIIPSKGKKWLFYFEKIQNGI